MYIKLNNDIKKRRHVSSPRASTKLPRGTQKLSARRPETGEERGFVAEKNCERRCSAVSRLTAPRRDRPELIDKIINILTAYLMQGTVLIPEKKKILQMNGASDLASLGERDGLKALHQFTPLH